MSDEVNLRTRYELAHTRILGSRLTSRWQSDEEICTSEGLTIAQYWEIALCEPMTASSFEHFLCEGFFTPEPRNHNDAIRILDIRGALRDAYKWGESFFIRTPTGKGEPNELRNLSVRPREAVEYLLRNQKRYQVVPSDLRKYIESTGACRMRNRPPSTGLAAPAQARGQPAAPDAATPPPVASAYASKAAYEGALTATNTSASDCPSGPNCGAVRAGNKAEIEGPPVAVTNGEPDSAGVVSESELRNFLNEFADGRKKESELKALATGHFAPKVITQSRWRAVFKGCSKKRKRGDTDRTIKSDNTSA
jgi:hypothetical protein